MRKFTGITLEENDRLDINLAITTRNTALNALVQVQQGGYIKEFEKLSEEQVKDYFAGICDAFIEAELTMHALRKDFSDKYKIPYDAIYDDGEIYILED